MSRADRDSRAARLIHAAHVHTTTPPGASEIGLRHKLPFGSQMPKAIKYFSKLPATFRNHPTLIPYPSHIHPTKRTPRAYTIYHYTDTRYIRRFVKIAQKRRAEIVQNAENEENRKKGVDRELPR